MFSGKVQLLDRSVSEAQIAFPGGAGNDALFEPFFCGGCLTCKDHPVKKRWREKDGEEKNTKASNVIK